MDNEEVSSFNAKKSRAQKFNRDKHHHHHHQKSHKNPETERMKKDVSKLKSAETIPSDADQGISINVANPSTLVSKADDKGIQDSKLFQRRVLTSNWGRYEKELDNNVVDSEHYTGTNFETLVNAPISGGHFKLKHEIDWDKEKAEIQAPWFQLNLEKLSNSLSTIPFYKRQDLPADLFSEEKIQQMTSRAQKIRPMVNITQKLGLVSLDSKTNSHETMLLASQETAERLNSQKIGENQVVCSGSDVDDLNELLCLDKSDNEAASSHNATIVSLPLRKKDEKQFLKKEQLPTTLSVSNAKQVSVSASPSASLDDWLDSILDD